MTRRRNSGLPEFRRLVYGRPSLATAGLTLLIFTRSFLQRSLLARPANVHPFITSLHYVVTTQGGGSLRIFSVGSIEVFCYLSGS